MIPLPKDLPDDPALLKQLLEQMLLERETSKGRIVIWKKKMRCYASACSDVSPSKQPIQRRHNWPCSKAESVVEAR
ncbi:hypothetical protein [Pseudomonas sp. Leaf59]|uniref:hypothetical protein n=1 Tax=Pseudomonas sp. Leaf59 TaxID=2876556 RepID=UPI003FA740CD